MGYCEWKIEQDFVTPQPTTVGEVAECHTRAGQEAHDAFCIKYKTDEGECIGHGAFCQWGYMNPAMSEATAPVLRCGKNIADAQAKCGVPCPAGTNIECNAGETCFAALPTAPCEKPFFSPSFKATSSLPCCSEVPEDQRQGIGVGLGITCRDCGGVAAATTNMTKLQCAPYTVLINYEATDSCGLTSTQVAQWRVCTDPPCKQLCYKLTDCGAEGSLDGSYKCGFGYGDFPNQCGGDGVFNTEDECVAAGEARKALRAAQDQSCGGGGAGKLGSATCGANLGFHADDGTLAGCDGCSAGCARACAELGCGCALTDDEWSAFSTKGGLVGKTQLSITRYQQCPTRCEALRDAATCGTLTPPTPVPTVAPTRQPTKECHTAGSGASFARCGTSWTDAASHCGCDCRTNADCDGDRRCFAGLGSKACDAAAGTDAAGSSAPAPSGIACSGKSTTGAFTCPATHPHCELDAGAPQRASPGDCSACTVRDNGSKGQTWWPCNVDGECSCSGKVVGSFSASNVDADAVNADPSAQAAAANAVKSTTPSAQRVTVTATATSRRRRLTHRDSVPAAIIRFEAHLHNLEVPAGVVMEEIREGIKNAFGVDGVLSNNLRNGHALFKDAVIDLESGSVYVAGAPVAGPLTATGPPTDKGAGKDGKLGAGPIAAIVVCVLGVLLVGSDLYRRGKANENGAEQRYGNGGGKHHANGVEMVTPNPSSSPHTDTRNPLAQI